ncbi:hypothetical protein SRHO_G00110980 [Serrasalmus rhombeus]
MNNYTASGSRSRVLSSVPPNWAVDRRGAAYLSQQPPLCLCFPPLPNLILPLGWYSASWSLALTSTDTHVVNIRKWLIEHRHYSLPRGIRRRVTPKRHSVTLSTALLSYMSFLTSISQHKELIFLLYEGVSSILRQPPAPPVSISILANPEKAP